MITPPNDNTRTKALELLGIELNPWQQSVLELISNSTDNIHHVVGPRQAGKTYFAAVYAILHALQTPDAVCKVIGPTRREQIDFIRTLREILYSTKLGNVAVIGSSWCHVRFANGSIIETGLCLSIPGAASQLRGAATGSLSIVTRVTDPDIAVATELAHTAKLAGTEMLIVDSKHSLVKTATLVSAAEVSESLLTSHNMVEYPPEYGFNQSRHHDIILTESTVNDDGTLVGRWTVHVPHPVQYVAIEMKLAIDFNDVVSPVDDDLTQSFLTST